MDLVTSAEMFCRVQSHHLILSEKEENVWKHTKDKVRESTTGKTWCVKSQNHISVKFHMNKENIEVLLGRI